MSGRFPKNLPSMYSFSPSPSAFLTKILREKTRRKLEKMKKKRRKKEIKEIKNQEKTKKIFQ